MEWGIGNAAAMLCIATMSAKWGTDSVALGVADEPGAYDASGGSLGLATRRVRSG